MPRSGARDVGGAKDQGSARASAKRGSPAKRATPAAAPAPQEQPQEQPQHEYDDGPTPPQYRVQQPPPYQQRAQDQAQAQAQAQAPETKPASTQWRERPSRIPQPRKASARTNAGKSEGRNLTAKVRDVVTQHKPALAMVFDTFAAADGGGGVGDKLRLPDFLRFCKDFRLRNSLLSRQQATTLFQLSCKQQRGAGGAKHEEALDENQFHWCLVQCATAAYAHLPMMKTHEKVEALFTHLDLHDSHRLKLKLTDEDYGINASPARVAEPRSEPRAERQSRAQQATAPEDDEEGEVYGSNAGSPMAGGASPAYAPQAVPQYVSPALPSTSTQHLMSQSSGPRLAPAEHSYARAHRGQVRMQHPNQAPAPLPQGYRQMVPAAQVRGQYPPQSQPQPQPQPRHHPGAMGMGHLHQPPQPQPNPAVFPAQQNRWQPAVRGGGFMPQPQQPQHPVMMAPSLAGGVRGGPAAQHLPQGYRQPQPNFGGGGGPGPGPGGAYPAQPHGARRHPHAAGPPMGAQPGMMAGPGGGGAVYF